VHAHIFNRNITYLHKCINLHTDSGIPHRTNTICMHAWIHI
jgi:hypothetical protein